MNDYILVLDEKAFEQLKDLGSRFPTVGKAVLNFFKEDTGWVVDMSRVEYCVLLTKVETFCKNTGLHKAMVSLARAQDEDFDNYFRCVKRDLDRFSSY